MTKRDRMIEKARQFTTGTYIRKFVATDFQRMIRAEYGASATSPTPAVVDGCMSLVRRRMGECVCVTCGEKKPWSGGLSGMHTGHFLASRRNSILFEETNVAPQCSSCNRYRSGMPQQFRLWMETVRGVEAIERLEKLKTEVRQFDRDELVDMRLEFKRRLKDAERKMT